MTFGGDNVSPAWTADGRGLVFSTRAANRLFSLASRGGPDVSRLRGVPAHAHLFPHSVARDGTIAAVRTTADGHFGIVLLSNGGEPRTVGTGPVDDMNPALSPDGQTIAYESDETGRPEIYVQPLRGSGAHALTTGGGSSPVWSLDGRMVYYTYGARLFSAPSSGPPSHEPVIDAPGIRVVAVSAAGRPLVERTPAAAERALVVVGWVRELRQRVPAPVTTPR
jgi:hypothetical protein